jgi:hypothetical protein
VPLALVAAAACALIWASRKPRVSAATRTFLPIALVAIVTVGGIYALFFREPGGRLAPHDAHAVRVFAHLYFTPVAFVFALAGYALVVWRSFWRAPALVLAVTTLSLFFLYKMRIWPEHFWLARRFIPAILPGAAIFASAALFAPLWLLPRERLRPGGRPIGAAFAAAGVIGALVLGRHYFVASQAIRAHVEYAGIIPQLERLAARFGDKDLVIVEARAASDLHTLALPLSYIWARNVLVLYSPRPDKGVFSEFLVWARANHDHVYFIGGGGTDLLSQDVRVERIASERFSVPEYEATGYQTYPQRSRNKPFDLTVYRFVDRSRDETTFRIDLGADDDVHVVRFHAKERRGDELNFRWTRDRSYFSIPRIKASDRELVMRMSNGGRPGKALPARVTVFLGERQIGVAAPDGSFRDYPFAITPQIASELAAAGTVEVRIESTTWTPRDVVGGADDRQLGVMIDRAEIR